MMRQAVLARPNLEVYGMGHCVVDDDNVVVMDDIYIPPQEVTSGQFQVSGDEFSKALATIVREHGEKWIEWCVMWHSHGTMGVSPSQKDVVNLNRLVGNNLPYAIGLVVNVAGDSYAWAELTKPWDSQAELDVVVGDAHYPKLAKKVDAWMEHVVEKKVPVRAVVGRMAQAAPSWWAREQSEDEEELRKLINGDHTSDDGPSDNDVVLAQAGLTFADGNLDTYSAKSIDRLATAVLAAKQGDTCDATHDDVSCILVKNHKQKVHVGIIDGLPAYFQNGGEPPSVARVQTAGFPI